ncbi:MAG: EF-hand domain-containing protein [Novosphingobium sp.]
MNRIVLGAVFALLLAGAGLFWWQGRAATESGAPPPSLAVGDPASDEPLPFAHANGLRGATPPEADPLTREQKRFDRLDHDRDGRITANEMLAPRAVAFRKLDLDRNNLLTFQEWAVRTSNRFTGGDGNRDGALSREEFATTKPKPGKHPVCRCTPLPRPMAGGRARGAPPPEEPAEDSGSDEANPEF